MDDRNLARITAMFLISGWLVLNQPETLLPVAPGNSVHVQCNDYCTTYVQG